VQSAVDFFSSNWDIFARSGQKLLPGMNNTCQEREEYNTKFFLIKLKVIVNIVEIIACRFKFFEDPISMFSLISTQEVTMDFCK
jgi:hypothetical protein